MKRQHLCAETIGLILQRVQEKKLGSFTGRGKIGNKGTALNLHLRRSRQIGHPSHYFFSSTWRR